MAYTPNAQDPTRPTAADFAGNMYLEFQALKAYIQTLLPNQGSLGVQGAFRNRIANGAMKVTQRGTSIVVNAGTSGYTLDQWIVNNAASTYATAAEAIGDGPSPYNLALKITQSGSGTGQVSLIQNIESVNVLDMVSGTQVTVSGWVKTTGTGVPINVSLYAAGAQDNFATSNIAGTASIGLTGITSNGYTYFKNTITLTRDCSLGMALNLSIPGGLSGGPIWFTQIQLEKGGFASNFEVIPAALDVSRCQRYFQAGQIYVSGYASGAGNNLQSTAAFSNIMRIQPTIVPTGVTTLNCSPTITGFNTGSGFLLQLLSTAAGLVAYTASYTASAEL